MHYGNEQTEQAVLACMLTNKDCSLEYDLLNTDDFVNDKHKNIFTGIKSLVKSNKKVDLLTLNSELKGQVPVTYLGNLNNYLPTTANFKEYIRELKDLTLKRKLYLLADEIRNPNKTGEELTEIAEREVFSLREETSTTEFANINELVLEVYGNIEKLSDGDIERGIKTGFTKLDDIVGGLRKTEYILLGARPSIGKTALAINIAENLLVQNKSIAFFSFEMSKQQLVERLIRGMSQVEIGFKKQLSAESWGKLQKASGYISKRKLYIDDNPNKKVSDMQSMCRKLKRQKGLDLVIIDYLQKVKSNVKGNKREQLEQVSNDIKNMAKMLNVPVLVVSSLSRANETRENKMPVMSDLRETGQLEYDADVIMFLHRDYYYERDNEDIKRDADIIVTKNRNGKIGRTKLLWYEEYTKFFNQR